MATEDTSPASGALCWDSDAETVVEGAEPEPETCPPPAHQGSSGTADSLRGREALIYSFASDRDGAGRSAPGPADAPAVSPMTSANILSQCALLFEDGPRAEPERPDSHCRPSDEGEGAVRDRKREEPGAYGFPPKPLASSAGEAAAAPPKRPRRARHALPITDDLCRALLQRLAGRSVTPFEIAEAFDTDDLRKLARRQDADRRVRIPTNKRALVELVHQLCVSGPLRSLLPDTVDGPEAWSPVSASQGSPFTGDGSGGSELGEALAPALAAHDLAALMPTPCTSAAGLGNVPVRSVGEWSSQSAPRVKRMRDAAAQTELSGPCRGVKLPRGTPSQLPPPAEAWAEPEPAPQPSAPAPKLRRFGGSPLLETKNLYTLDSPRRLVPYTDLHRPLLEGMQVCLFRDALRRFSLHYTRALDAVSACGGVPFARDIPLETVSATVTASRGLTPEEATAAAAAAQRPLDTLCCATAQVLSLSAAAPVGACTVLCLPRLVADTPEFVVTERVVEGTLGLAVAPGDWVGVPFASSTSAPSLFQLRVELEHGLVVEVGHADGSDSAFGSVHVMWLERSGPRSREWLLTDPIAQMDNAISPWDIHRVARRCSPSQCLPFPWLGEEAGGVGERRAWRLAKSERTTALDRLMRARGATTSSTPLQVAGMTASVVKGAAQASLRERIAWQKALSRVAEEHSGRVAILGEHMAVELVLRLLDWHPVVSFLFDAPPAEDEVPGYAQRLGHAPHCLDHVIDSFLRGGVATLDDLAASLEPIWDDPQRALPPLSFLHAMAEAARVTAAKMLFMARLCSATA